MSGRPFELVVRSSSGVASVEDGNVEVDELKRADEDDVS